MRLLIASMAALAAVAFAAPSFAQDETMPTPTAKPKAPTTASCNKIKSSSQRSACLKKVQVAKAPSKKTKKTTTPPAAPKSPEMGQLPPASAPAPTAAAPSSGPVSVPPLPSKTI
ncbi:hypothetical protein [uncultured Reyranella sp.]|uniref:hypothetical protein n=1 Tax=uncultured Reyranella sp. TaxID=735512 RepID=UPI0025F19D12|nr:hypothetical protein [uncultured Reyranella sp.]